MIRATQALLRVIPKIILEPHKDTRLPKRTLAPLKVTALLRATPMLLKGILEPLKHITNLSSLIRLRLSSLP
jgi:hypothetical protein